MKAASLALVAFATLATFASPTPARADDTVHVCIAASTQGQTLRKQGKLLDARDQMIACARDACPAIVRSHCARWLTEVDALIPSVVVRAEDASGADVIGARVSIDGQPGKLDGQPVRLDPGEHTVAIESDHAARREERVLLAEGEKSRLVTLRLAPAVAVASTHDESSASHDPSSHGSARSSHVPTGAWVLGGLGVVALGGATYFGLTANSDLHDLQSTCSPHCSDSRAQPGRTDAVLFDVSLGVGAAAVAGALVWGLGFPTSKQTSTSAARFEVRPVAGGALTTFRFAY